MARDDDGSTMTLARLSPALAMLLACSGLPTSAYANAAGPPRGKAPTAFPMGAADLPGGVLAAKLLQTSPLDHTFANTRVGSTSATKLSTVIETTSTPVTIDGVDENCASFSREVDVVFLTDGLETSRSPATFPVTVFTLVDPETLSVERQYLEIYMAFAPVARGPANCAVTVQKSGSDPVIMLNGTGVAPVLAVSPVSLGFANRRIGTNSAAQDFTVSNNGDPGQSLTVSSLALDANSEDWVIGFDNSTPIASGASRIGTVAFSPDAAGAQNATLTITGDDPVDGDETISLSGSGLTATVAASPSPLDIGEVAIGSTSSGAITVSNTANSNGTTLTVHAVDFSGTHAADFSLSSPALPTTIAAGAGKTFMVECAPTATGARSAAITLDTDADNVPQDPQVTLSCTGIGGPIAYGTVADSGDGALAEGEQTIVGITQLLVTFHGAMSDPAGSSTPGDVTNPAGYRLFAAGPDGLLQTAGCVPPAGDDLEVQVASVEYFGAAFLAALSVPAPLALAPDTYRLHACATLKDAQGDAIAPGSRSFVVVGNDRLANPNFDDSLAGWVVTEPIPGSLAWQAADAGDAPSSGSARVSTTSGAGQVFALSQCVDLEGADYFARMRARIASPVADAPAATIAIEHFAAAGCSGTSLGAAMAPAIIGDSATLWETSASDGLVPPGARSALVSAWVQGGTADAFTVAVDDLFYEAPPPLLRDGFESGATSLGSSSTPTTPDADEPGQ